MNYRDTLRGTSGELNYFALQTKNAMALILPVRGVSPQFGKNCFVADNATITGEVSVGDNCSIWFGAVLRGDVSSVRIGNNVNIQDLVVIHGTYQKSLTVIGNDVSVGHRAILHGCEIGDNVLIGMGAIVMDHCVIESNSIIAAGAIVTEGMVVTSGSLFAGVPAKKIKDISPEILEEKNRQIAHNYLLYSGWYK